MRYLALIGVLAACGGDDGGGGGIGGNVDAAVASCATMVSCTTDADCTTSAPGTRCNTGLPVPRCQPLDCGGAGTGCAGPEFCSAGLVCFDSAHFGESATIYEAGVCTGWANTRDTCTSRCMAAWSRDVGMVFYPCSQQQATALCTDVCGTYPMWDGCETYFDQYNSNDFRFGYMNCPTTPGANCPYIGVRCGTTDTNIQQSSCSP